jgi:hypothetical protein
MGNREVKSDIRSVARSLKGWGRLLALVITEQVLHLLQHYCLCLLYSFTSKFSVAVATGWASATLNSSVYSRE